MLEEIQMLFHIGVPEIFPCSEVAGVACLNADLLVAMKQHFAVVHGHFQSCREVDIRARACECIAVRHPALSATGYGIVISIFKGSAFREQQGHNFLVID